MEKKKTMLLDWMRKVHQLEYAHCYQSEYYRKIEKRIGISAFVLSSMVAFSYKFPEIKNEWFNTYLFFLDKDYFLPFLLFIVALFTGLQTFLKPNEKSDIHRKLGLEYEKIRHTIEITLTKEESELNTFTIFLIFFPKIVWSIVKSSNRTFPWSVSTFSLPRKHIFPVPI